MADLTSSSAVASFLMHRVELKVSLDKYLCSLSSTFLMHRVELKVLSLGLLLRLLCQFLMHRVELKALHRKKNFHLEELVPNAPCGVESKQRDAFLHKNGLFLMHRVELKGISHHNRFSSKLF